MLWVLHLVLPLVDTPVVITMTSVESKPMRILGIICAKDGVKIKGGLQLCIVWLDEPP